MSNEQLPNIIINRGTIESIIRDIIRDELRRMLPPLIRNATAKPLLNTDELCELTGWSRRTVQYLRDSRQLPFHQDGRRILFRTEDIDKYLESKRIEARGGDV